MPTFFRRYRSSSASGESTSRNLESRPFLRSDVEESGDVELETSGPALDPHHQTPLDRAEISNSDGLASFTQFPNTLHRQQRPWGLNHTSAFNGEKRLRRLRSCFGKWSLRKTYPQSESRLLSRLVRLSAYVLMFLGVVQLVGILLGLAIAFLPDRAGIIYRYLSEHKSVNRFSDLSKVYTADVLPVKCHSHNDYWRTVPLKSAIQAGCTGVEADVWLHNDELYVGHTESSLKTNRTLESLYIGPLLDILDKQNPVNEFQPVELSPRNGIFDTAPAQTLVLLIDFKTDGEELWPVVQAQLEPLRSREYLTYFNGTELTSGPITVVATGNAPFHKVVANTTYRDIFFDAPLAEMAEISSDQDSISGYDPAEEIEYLAAVSGTNLSQIESDQGQGYSGLAPVRPSIYTKYNSYYTSTSLQLSIGWPFPYLNQLQRTKIAAQIRGAHTQGLQVRYWNVPDWPISWRNYLWRELMLAGIDYLNVDDLRAATKGLWKSENSYGRIIWGSGDW